MMDAVQRAAEARRSGTGGRVMGGLGVGPTGHPQVPMIEQQHAVSGTRGRRSADLQHASSSSSQQRQMLQHQEHASGSAAPTAGEKPLMLTYNGQNGASIQRLQQIVRENSAPHPALFDMLVDVVDVGAMRIAPQCEPIVRKLRAIADFNGDLAQGCVLFDYGQRMAYNDAQAMREILRLQKDSCMAQIVDAYLQQRQEQRQQAAQATSSLPLHGGHGSPGAIGGGALSAGLTGGQKSMHQIARRSVLRGADPKDLELLAKQAETYVRREDGGRSGGMRMSAAGGGGGGGGGGSVGGATLCDSLGNQHAAAGGAEGSLVQIDAKAYGR